VWPYAIPITFSNGSGLSARLNDLSMRPIPVVTKAYAPSLAPPATAALVNVVLPASADLWFEGMQIPGGGSLRQFTSPELNPLNAYTYDVRASWLDNGKVVTQSQRLLVRAGDRLTVTFPASTAAVRGPILRSNAIGWCSRATCRARSIRPRAACFIRAARWRPRNAARACRPSGSLLGGAGS